jgi:hypothetical protein
MPYRTFNKLRRVTETAVLENKRLGGLLALIRQSQADLQWGCLPTGARH